jgi:hypothetical protein
MKKEKLVAIGILLAGFLSLVPGYLQASEGPVISNSFAVKELVPGYTWKIYIKAKSPEAKMKYIYAHVDQAGGMGYPISLIRIREENQGEISGYVFLSTITAGQPLDYVNIRLTIHIRDDKGRFSEPVVFPLTFNARAAAQEAPEGIFLEKDLGPVMIRLRPVNDDGNSHDN